MSDNSHAPKVPKAIVEQLEVHVEGVGERGTGDTPGPSDRDAAEASAQKGSSHMGEMCIRDRRIYAWFGGAPERRSSAHRLIFCLRNVSAQGAFPQA